MYYWEILHKSDDELVKKVLRAQQLSPVKHDWCITVQEDLKNLEIDLNEEEICSMKKLQFKINGCMFDALVLLQNYL